MTRRNFILGMFASAALLAVGVRLPRFGGVGAVWIKGSAFSYDCGQSWTTERPADGTPVGRIYSLCESAYMEAGDMNNAPTYSPGAINFDGRQTMHVPIPPPTEFRLRGLAAHYIIP